MTVDLPVSLCMIVKNEEEFIATSLKSVRTVLGFEDIVVVDTGSTDRTVEIAHEFGCRVFDFKWINDFSAARNFSAEKAIHDWIFFLDADEEILEADIDALSRFIKDDRNVGVGTRIELTNLDANPVSRLYNRTQYMLKGIIHEQVEPIGNKKKILKDIPVVMNHHGYLPEVSEKKGTHERNARMLKEALEEHPNDPYLLFKLGNAYYYKDLDVALGYFEEALKHVDDFSLLYVYGLVECYGYALINTGQYEKALEVKNAYAKYYDYKPEFRFLTAHIYQNNGLFQEAVECYESCIGADIVDYMGITSYLSYYNIGVILECVGMIDEAIGVYGECGDYDPAKQRLLAITT